MQTINFTPYKTAPSFGALKIKGTEGMQFIKKDSPNAIKKLDVIKNELDKWDKTTNYVSSMIEYDNPKLTKPEDFK